LKMIKTNMHVHYKSPFIVDTLPQTCGEWYFLHALKFLSRSWNLMSFILYHPK
jgi:hypothetical protein